MMDPPQPVFTLRGHKFGVTALALAIKPPAILISGDESGTLSLWDCVTFKRLATHTGICDSKILSLKVIKLNLNSCDTSVLVVQSRNHGVLLVPCDENFLQIHASNDKDPREPHVIARFPTYESLFSRGDSATIFSENKAILAYPSALESCLVTVRFVGRDAETEISGSAARVDADPKLRQSSVFDIHLRACDTATQQGESKQHLMFVGYEDGALVAYGFKRDRTDTVPELKVTGLKIEALQTFHFGLTDFVSAFDVTELDGRDHDRAGAAGRRLVCGSATRELRFIRLDETLEASIEETVKLTKPGISAISIRPDLKLVATGGWDNATRLFSLKSRRPLAVLKNHTKQLSSILYIRKEDLPAGLEGDTDGGGCGCGEWPAESSAGRFLMCCGSLDGTISVFDIY